MFELMINGGEVNEEKYSVKEYSVKVDVDDRRLILSFITSDDIEIKYDIHADTRASDINLIKKHLDEEYEKAEKERITYEISEYPERNYIYVGGENLKQYTGVRV